MDRLARTRAVNGIFRKNFTGDELVVSAGIVHLPNALSLLSQIRDYSAFTSSDHLHDSGAINFQGRKIVWRIEAFNADLTAAADDPLSSSARRIMTVMLAAEVQVWRF